MAKQKVLVIDDEKPTLSMFRLFLQAYGYEALIAEDGQEGLALFESESPPIVFTDIKMPGMDGFEVLDRIKGQSPETEVIVITGHGDMDLAVEALNREATDFINKPIHRSALETALHRAEKRLQSEKYESAITSSVQENDVRIIEIQGNINTASERTFMDAHANIGGDETVKILLRFHANTSINGAGIGVLIQFLSKCNANHQKIAISGITENFGQIFDMVGITRLAEIFEEDEKAIEFLTDK